MGDKITFELDGRVVEADPDETIWQVAQRAGTTIPHLCWRPEKGYRADGNCRACMVEIDGERVLAASCVRKPADGMKVKTQSERATKSREMVFELLLADQPAKSVAHDPQSAFWTWVGDMGIAETSRYPAREAIESDTSHTAIAVNLDACIHCNLCVRACREVQSNDVIGMAYRGHNAKIVFDFDDAMGESTCVACGECVQACPTGALMEANLLNETGVREAFADKTVDTLCPYCGVGCQTRVYTDGNRILKVDGRDGPANENRLCVKGRFGFDYIHHPDRLTVPLIRREDAPAKTGNVEISRDEVSTYFREATWEEALEAATGGLAAVHGRDGGKAIAGFGSAKCSNEEAYLFQKLIRQRFETNNVDHCTRLCHASSVAALMEGLNSGAVTAPFTAAGDAECIIVIGARPAENHPVAATYLKNAAKRGAKLIVMDPRGPGAGHCAVCKPHPAVQGGHGRGAAERDAQRDHERRAWSTSNTCRPTRKDLRTLRRGSRHSRRRRWPMCAAFRRRRSARSRGFMRARRASIIFWGMGISQHVHGTDNARCLIALALTTGQIGRPGTGLHPLRGQNNVQGASDAGLIPMVYPDYKSVEDAEIRKQYEAFWGRPMDPVKGLTVVEIMDAIHADQIKAMYILGENPAMSDPDQSHARAALAKLEHLVVQDIFMTETAWHADVILPAAAHAEKAGTYTNTNRQVQMARPVIDPPGEARADWAIVTQMANRLGLGWTYSHPREVFNEMAQVMPSLANISWERIEREESVTYPADAPDQPGNEIIFAKGFPTASGRGRIVAADVTPPDELPDDDYPMVLTTGRLLEHWHTGAMTRRAEALDALEPEAIAALNRWDMKRLGVAPGDMVRVATRRGEVTLKAREDRDVAEGMVFIPFCFAEAAANLLTNPQLDPMGKIPEFKFCAARIERAEAEVEAAE